MWICFKYVVDIWCGMLIKLACHLAVELGSSQDLEAVLSSKVALLLFPFP